MSMSILTRLSRAAAVIAFGLVTAAAQPAVPPTALTPDQRTAIVAALDQAPSHGLPAIAPSSSDPALRDQLIAYAAWQYGGRTSPRELHNEWGVQPPAPPDPAEMAGAAAARRLDGWIAALPPAHSGYAQLRELRRRYQRLADVGGWPALPLGETLRQGDAGERVSLLRRRLAMEGFRAAPDAAPDAFGAGLAAAVLNFQDAHGLEPDAVVGPATLRELNVTAQARLAQIDLNLERWRWLPRELPAERIEVNIAAAEAIYFVDNAPALTMRVVVADPGHHTPQFYSAVAAVVFNPPWNVPDSIARNEILPRAAADPGYLARNNFSYFGGRLVQAPGPESALGLFKFDFPSPYGVYLHDTPGKTAFARTDRFLSHGCVRLEKPRELAELLMARQGVGRAQIDGYIAGRSTLRVDLQRPVPLFMTYRTAEGGADGTAVFWPDAYGWDARLAEALVWRFRNSL
jgi:murein L,D-transpeptidase YcbB/YkuD